MEAKSFTQNAGDHAKVAKSFDRAPEAPDQYAWLYPWIFPAAIALAVLWGLLDHS